MSKIDNSTFKAIEQEKKYNSKPHYEKGEYGHARHNKNKKLILTVVLFAVILSDVLISLIVFQTRKTWFIILGCVMSIPFARNLIDYFMAIKSKPLNKETYEKTKEMADRLDKELLYDISITDTDGMVFVPCVYIESNNIIAFTPEETNVKDREKIKTYINGVNTLCGTSYRIFVTENINTFEKELKKIKKADAEAADKDREVAANLLTMGF